MPADLAALDAEVKATRDEMIAWLEGKREHQPVKSKAGNFLSLFSLCTLSLSLSARLSLCSLFISYFEFSSFLISHSENASRIAFCAVRVRNDAIQCARVTHSAAPAKGEKTRLSYHLYTDLLFGVLLLLFFSTASILLREFVGRS